MKQLRCVVGFGFEISGWLVSVFVVVFVLVFVFVFPCQRLICCEATGIGAAPVCRWFWLRDLRLLAARLYPARTQDSPPDQSCGIGIHYGSGPRHRPHPPRGAHVVSQNVSTLYSQPPMAHQHQILVLFPRQYRLCGSSAGSGENMKCAHL